MAVDCKGESLKPGESVPMVGVVEKPKLTLRRPTWRWAASSARYLAAAGEKPGAGDEIQPTDAIDMLIEKETLSLSYERQEP